MVLFKLPDGSFPVWMEIDWSITTASSKILWHWCPLYIRSKITKVVQNTLSFLAIIQIISWCPHFTNQISFIPNDIKHFHLLQSWKMHSIFTTVILYTQNMTAKEILTSHKLLFLCKTVPFLVRNFLLILCNYFFQCHIQLLVLFWLKILFLSGYTNDFWIEIIFRSLH